MRRLLPAILAFAMTIPAAAGERIDPMCAPEDLPSATRPMPDLSRLFARAATRAEDPHASPVGGIEVLVARVAADGSIVVSCVDSEAGARAFFSAERPLTKSPARDK